MKEKRLPQLLTDQELSAFGHSEEKSLAIYRDLALADVAKEDEQAMRFFPVQ